MPVQERGYVGMLFAEISIEAFSALRVIELALEHKTTNECDIAAVEFQLQAPPANSVQPPKPTV